MLNAFVGMRNAADEFHQDPASAGDSISELRALLAAMEDYNEEIEDEDITADIELIAELIRVMLSQGAPDPDIVDVEDPWPCD